MFFLFSPIPEGIVETLSSWRVFESLGLYVTQEKECEPQKGPQIETILWRLLHDQISGYLL